MKLLFRQGLVRFQTNIANRPTFLLLSDSGSRVDLVVSPDPTLITFAHGQADYLFEETKTVAGAWTGLDTTTTCWLYWDINIATAVRTFGFTSLLPIVSATQPTKPKTDQHWFDLSTNKMKVWAGTVWVEKIRVFAGLVQNGVLLTPNSIGSQVGLNTSAASGFIMFDADGVPLRKIIPGGSQFITTESNLSSHVSRMASIRVEAAIVPAAALETIPQWSLVCYKDRNKIGVASTLDTSHPAVGLATEAIDNDEVRSYQRAGYVVNTNWDWTVPAGTPLFCSPTGTLTTVVPQVSSIQQVGVVVSPTSIDLHIQPQIILVGA